MTTTSAPKARARAKKRGIYYQPPSMRVIAVKIVLLALVDAVAVFAMSILFFKGDYLVAGVVLVATLLVNWIYLSPGLLPAKYLTPGLVFLAIFQLFVIVYSLYIAFTNYGDGHNSTKDDAISSIVQQNTLRVEGSPAYRVTVVEGAGGLGLLAAAPDGQVLVGTPDAPLQPVDPASVTLDGERPTAVEGWTSLGMQDILQRQQEVAALQVPLSDDLADGFLRTTDATNGYVYQSTFVYDEAADTVTDTVTGTVYQDLGNGAFETADGQRLGTGWQIFIGGENFLYPFQNPTYGVALFGVLAWTFGYAILSVALSFFLGLFLAIALNDPRMRSKQIYRVLSILPYAFPSFLGALVWLGLLNTEFGYINNTFLGSADIPWLTDPVLAKISVLVVNLWLGFPYMFLICLGALQSIPEELTEAAIRRRRDRLADLRAHQVPAPARLDRAAAHLVVRVQLQQLQHHLLPHPRRAAHAGGGGERRPHRPAHHARVQDGVPGRHPRLRPRGRAVDHHLHHRRHRLDHRVPADQGTGGPELMNDPADGSTSCRIDDAAPEAPRPAAPRMAFRKWMRELGWRHLVGIAVVLFAVFPLVYVLSASFNPGGTLTGSNDLFREISGCRTTSTC